MIESLAIDDLALIERVDLTFDTGLTALTGETGAGKTMLIEALNLALGERADTGLVRSGAGAASVRLVFSDAGGARRVMERTVSRDGRHRCRLDGRTVTAAALGEAAEGLVDLHGQHEHQRLLHQRWHADYLDRSIGERALAARAGYSVALSRARAVARTLEELTQAAADRERLAERLRYEISEIEAAAPVVGEDEDLALRLPVLRHAEQLAHAVLAARERLAGPDDAEGADALGGGLDAVRGAHVLLEGVAQHDPFLESLADRLAAAGAELEDVKAELERYADAIDRDPAALETAEDRAAVLGELARKYGGGLSAVLEHLDQARATSDALEGGEGRVASLEAELGSALGEVARFADSLGELRREAAPAFAAAVESAARALAMPAARFVVEIEALVRPDDAAALAAAPGDGLDRVEFLFSANEGEAVRALGRVASGGELSRLMLAVKTVLGAADAVATLVFDEIDAGVGGETAKSVAEALARLARDHQVLVITHLPQIAALADRNLVVEKEAVGGRTVTSVRPVDGTQREAELARMLSGEADSEVSLAHARELLARRGA